MLDIRYIQQNETKVIEKLNKRGVENASEVITKLLSLDQQRKADKTQIDALLTEKNSLAKKVGVLMQQGNQSEAEEIKAQANEMKPKIQALTQSIALLESQIDAILYALPNLPYDDVPLGKGEDDNEVVFQSGELPSSDDSKLPHWDLAKQYDIVDFELGNKIAGAGFPVYKGKGAKLQRALINFFLDEAEKAGYLEVQPPILVNHDSATGTGQLPDKEGVMYAVPNEKLFLIPTSEVPITNLFRGEILEEAALPQKVTGYTPCFRREAGSWGSHVRGLNRLHQFDKVELVQVVHPDKSYETLESMRQHVESLLQKLGLPYRVLNLCTGDLGFTSAKTYDLEVFAEGQGRWLEVSSVSNCEAYQSNRLQLKYRDANKKKHLLHTLNGSALALPRIVAAILERYQGQDGIVIPKVLQPYTRFDTI